MQGIPLTIWHIGGDGPIGPGDRIIERYPGTKLVTFDARPEHGMPLCFDEHEGEADFYITANGMASSLLRSAPAAWAEQCKWEKGEESWIDVWGEITKVVKTERVRTTTVDAYAAEHGAPDILSLDVQGAEMRVLRGAVATMQSLVCAITEIETWEIYEGQGLLDHQLAFFREHGFRLVGLFNTQPWHQGEPNGEGFMTVAEGIWLRFAGIENLDFPQLFKLALVAAAYDRNSYAKKLFELAKAKVVAAGVVL